MVEKLTHKLDLLNLNSKIIGKKVFHFNKIQSTNLYAKKLVNENIDEGTIVIADVQTKGRGRKNRSWVSPYGGLWFSVILYPDIIPKRGMAITMAASISVSQAIKDITGLKTKIKWPNDVLLNDKKVCGILTELNADIKKIKNAIVGIGINVNNKVDEELKEIATSLKQEFGSEVTSLRLLGLTLENFDNNYEKLKINDFEYIKKIWLSYSNIIGKKVKITEENTMIVGVVKDIDDNGYLILKTDNGIKNVLNGDIIYL